MMLRKSDVVNTRRDGKQIYYSIKDERMIEVLNTLYSLYCPKTTSRNQITSIFSVC